MATALKLKVIARTTQRYRVGPVKDSAGNIVNLGGASIYFTVRKYLAQSADDTDALFQKAIGNGIALVAGGAGGLADLILEPADTRDKNPATYPCDLLVITAGNDVIIPAKGEIEIEPAVTRRPA